MTPSAITAQTSQRVPYTDHSQDYIPQTSPWNERRICDYISADNLVGQQKCCSGVKTIDRAIDKAYKNGIQSHLGIKAIQEYPCITQGEMSKLSNDLEKAIKQHGIKMEVPEGLNPSKRPLGIDKDTLNYCKQVVFEKLGRELDRLSDSKPIAFSKEIVRYCQYALTLRPGNINPSEFQNKIWE